MPDATCTKTDDAFSKYDATRYQMLRILVESPFKKKILAVDGDTGKTVFVTTFSANLNSGDSLANLELAISEASKLLNTTRVSKTRAELYGVSHDSTQLTLVSEAVDGQNLFENISQHQPVSIDESLALAQTLAEACLDISSTGVTPRLLSPFRICRAQDSDQSQFILEDSLSSLKFYIDADDGFSLHHTELCFLPPEKFTSHFGQLGEPSQIYSIACIVYYAITGENFFWGKTREDVIRNTCYINLPKIRKKRHDAPPSLEEVLNRCLKKHVTDRYQNISALLDDLKVIRSQRTEQRSDLGLVIGQSDTRFHLTESAFVTPENELRQWTVHLGHLRRGLGGLVFLEAESGGGKSRLLEEFEILALERDIDVMTGQGLDHSARTPFQMLSSIAQRIVTLGTKNPKRADTIRRSVSLHKEALSIALPQLREFFGSVPSALGPETFGEFRSLNALCALIDVLGTEQAPLVILLDDCQWADELTLRFLQYWHQRAQRSSIAKRYVTIVASFRTEEVSAKDILRQIKPALHIQLEPLNLDKISSFAHSMAGRIDEAIVSSLARVSQGSPFMCSAVLRGMMESSTIVFTKEDGWRLSPKTSHQYPLPERAAAILETRMKLLPQNLFERLSLAAVLGKEFSLDDLVGISCISEDQIRSELKDAERRNLVVVSLRKRFSFIHDKIRETILSLLNEVERRNLHLAVAEFLERKFPDEVFRISFHFNSSGEHVRAFPFALSGAQQARTQHSLELAEQQFRAAKKGAEEKETRLRFVVSEGLGDILMLRGKYGDAQNEFEYALTLLTNPLDRAKLKQKMGELAFKKGEVETAIKHQREALQLLHRATPTTVPRFLFELCFQGIVQVLHSIFPQIMLARKPLHKRDEADVIALGCYTRLAYAYWFGSGKIQCGWAHLRGMNLAEKFTPSLELAQSYSEHAPVMTMIPYFSRGVRYAQLSYQIRKELNDVWGQGQSLSFHGVCLYGASQWQESIQKLSDAISLLERTGDRWEVNTAHWHIAFCYFRLGDLQRASEESQQVYRDGIEIGDIHASTISLWSWTAASEGRLPLEMLDNALNDERGDPFTEILLSQAKALCLMRQARHAEAAELLEKTCHLVEKKSLTQDYCLASWTSHASALRMQIESLDLGDFKTREALLRKANTVAKRALKISNKYKNHLPQTLREFALIQSLNGNSMAAAKLLRRSLTVAELQGAKFEYAQSLLMLSSISKLLGLPDAEQQRAMAIATLDRLRTGVVLPSS